MGRIFRILRVDKMEMDSEKLRKLKKKELKILMEFDKVCEEIGVDYTLAHGTLLGAVRHKGFIPWDEDVDVAMLRKDYEKFVESGQELLPENLFIQTSETDPDYHNNHAKLLDISTTLKEPVHKCLDIKDGIFIDIFPIDAESSIKYIRWIDNILIFILQSIRFSSMVSKKSILGKFRKIFLSPLAKLIGNHKLNKLETYIRIKNNKKGKSLAYCDFHRSFFFKEEKLLDINIFLDLEQIDFENREFQAIKERDYYLSVKYGNYNELPPKKDRIPQHNYIEMDF